MYKIYIIGDHIKSYLILNHYGTPIISVYIGTIDNTAE